MRKLALLGCLVATLALAAASPNNTVVLVGSNSTITDAAGNVWGISQTAPCTATWASPGQKSMVTLKGSVDPTTCNVIAIAYVNGLIWQENSAQAWYSKTIASAPWTGPAAASPLPAATATLLWTAPTINVDGSTIIVPLTYNIYQGLTGNEQRVAIGITGVTTVISTGIVVGSTCFYVTSVEGTVEGPKSIEACTGLPPPVPAAPTNLTVQ